MNCENASGSSVTDSALAAIAFCALIGAPAAAVAQCPGLAGRMVDTEVDHKEGLFVLTEDVACMLRELEELDLVRERVRLLEHRRDLDAERAVLMKKAIAVGGEALTDLGTALEISSRRTVAAENALDSFWRSPSLWTGIGAVFTLLVGGVVAFGLGAV